MIRMINMDNEDKNSQTVKNIHDNLFWDIYGRPKNAAGFLTDFLPPNILKAVDLEYIKVGKKSYLSEEYRAHYTDIVVETRFADNIEEPVFVYFLLEHKSDVPKRPALQLLRYMVEQWHDLEKKELLGSKLPPIFPILIYHGKQGWTPGVHFHDIVHLPHDDMKPYVPDFQYLLFDASKENEDQYITSVVIRCWLIIVKYLNDPEMREKLSEVLRLLHNFLENREAREYIEIFMKYLANTDNKVTRDVAVNAVEKIFPGRSADMMRGWAKEYVEEGMQKGMLTEARENVLEALDARFSKDVPEDVYKKVQALNNRILLKKLLRSAAQSEDIDSFKKILQEIHSEREQEQ